MFITSLHADSVHIPSYRSLISLQGLINYQHHHQYHHQNPPKILIIDQISGISMNTRADFGIQKSFAHYDQQHLDNLFRSNIEDPMRIFNTYSSTTQNYEQSQRTFAEMINSSNRWLLRYYLTIQCTTKRMSNAEKEVEDICFKCKSCC